MTNTFATLIDFVGAPFNNIALVRVFANARGSKAEVGAASGLAGLEKLLSDTPKEHLSETLGLVKPRGTYLRFCHTVEPVGWSGPAPSLKDRYATQFPAFMIDLDPERQKDANASEAELQAARDCASEILEWMQAVLGQDTSYCLTIESGNGVQLLMRCSVDLSDNWIASELLERMKGRWPAVDERGACLTVGPACPGTWKRKYPETDGRPHREVRVTEVRPGERRLTSDDIRALSATLPDAPKRRPKKVHRAAVAYTPLEATHRLPLEPVLRELFGGVKCPACGRSDSSVALLDGGNTLSCLRSTCPGKRPGWTALHTIGWKLFEKARGYSPQELDAIVEYADSKWSLDVREEEPFSADRIAQIDEMVSLMAPFVRPLDTHCSIVPRETWRMSSKSPRLVAARVYDQIVHAYCPDWAEERPMVFDSLLYAYHQPTGMWVPVLRTIPGVDETSRVSRILEDQEDSFGILASNGKKFVPWAPGTEQVLRELERKCAIPGYFLGGTHGLCCADGFLEIRNGKWASTQHHPKHRARGFVRLTCRQVAEGYGADEAVRALKVILAKLLSHKSEQYRDHLLTVYIEQLGGALCKVPTKLRQGFIFHGAENTGKSVLIDITTKLFERLSIKAVATTIEAINNEYPPEDILDAAFLHAAEESAFGSGRLAKTARLKNLSEGSGWPFNRKGLKMVECRSCPLMMFASNHEPAFDETTGAISKRFYIVQFPSTSVPEGQLDLGMTERFLSEHMDGLIAAAVRGAVSLLQAGRTVLPADSELAVESREAGRTKDPVEDWLTENTAYERSQELLVARDEAYEACRDWAVLHGYRDPFTISYFVRRLKRAGVEVRAVGRGSQRFVGLRKVALAQSEELDVDHTEAAEAAIASLLNPGSAKADVDTF